MAEYIEREAAKRVFNLHFGGVSHAVIANRLIDEITAADVVERKRGRWIGEADGYADGEFVYDVWYCSECNHCIDDGTDDPYLLPNFCPNCGADMREV